MKNTTVIIHFRNDCEDRIFNLKTILRYLNDVVKPREIILINDDKNIDPIMKWVKDSYPSIKLLYLENSDEFKKSYSFNESAKRATSNILCFYDVDVLIPLDQLVIAERLIYDNESDHVYPFGGLFIDVKKHFFDNFLPTFDLGILKSEIKETTLGYFNGNVEIVSDKSPGGCNIISKEAFEKIGGYDDNFIGWGFEDTDFRERSGKINRVKYLNKTDFLYHLEHSTHSDIVRSEQPHYTNNLKRFYSNQNG
jgi:predicted glycosyltransferase involved in capsule biosynthesis